MNVSTGFRSSGDLLADRRFEFARATLARGDTHATADLLEQTLELAPRFAPAWLLLGQVRALLGDDRCAVAALREAMRLEPQDVLGARLALARLGSAPEGEPMTHAYVSALFDEYAYRFDGHLSGELRYRGPALLADALERVRREQGRPFRFAPVLDLGCGTGLMGEALRPIATHLAGCDLSPRMIERARAKALYDSLVVCDALEFLAGATKAGFDLVTAADVVVYLGDLAPLMGGVARVLAPGGLFGFTAQACEGSGYRLGEDLRYHHSETYLRELASSQALDVKLLERASQRLDRGMPMPGLVLVVAA